MEMDPTDPIMDEFVIVMNLFVVPGVTRSVGFDCEPKRNV